MMEQGQWQASLKVLPLALSLSSQKLYTLTVSHRLNLCVVKCCSIREISNMMESADKISRFFNNSPKRQLALERWIDENFTQHGKRKKSKICGALVRSVHANNMLLRRNSTHPQIGIVRPDLMPSCFSDHL